jgi:hypothetical protein
MEQNSGQNKNASFFEKNQNYLIAGVIAVILVGVVYFASTRGDDDGQQNQNQNQQQQEQSNQPQSGENPANGETNNNQNSGQNGQQEGSTTTGDVSAVGTLRVSDNPAKGNLMLESNRGKIYIATKRDYSGSVGKQVTLQASGDIKSFTFLGFKEAAGNIAQAPSQEDDKGGSNEPTGNVSFSGRFDKSDNSAKGNYQIVSGQTKVYLQSQRDYSALVGSDVNLNAQGSLKSFTGAVVTKK